MPIVHWGGRTTATVHTMSSGPNIDGMPGLRVVNGRDGHCVPDLSPGTITGGTLEYDESLTHKVGMALVKTVTVLRLLLEI